MHGFRCTAAAYVISASGVTKGAGEGGRSRAQVKKGAQNGKYK